MPGEIANIPTHLVAHPIGKVAWKIPWIDSLFLCPSNIIESTQFAFLFAFGSMDKLMRFELSRCMCSEATFITNKLFVLFASGLRGLCFVHMSIRPPPSTFSKF